MLLAESELSDSKRDNSDEQSFDDCVDVDPFGAAADSVSNGLRRLGGGDGQEAVVIWRGVGRFGC